MGFERSRKVKLVISGMMLLPPVAIIIISLIVFPALPPIFYIVIGFFFVADFFIAYMFLWGSASKNHNSLETAAEAAGIPYSDSLISIDDNGITIRLFYFPFGAKRVNFSDIETVQVFKGGCLRIWGSGDFRTWFGLDWGRTSRSMTFIIKRKNTWSRVGFAAKNSESVANILRSKKLLQVQ